MAKRMMLGNEAVAQGVYEAGCMFASSYPGTPSTEITEFLAAHKDLHAEWAPNEKVACESAYGASMAGVRSFSAMKHVGMNVAADLVFTAAYSGVNAGFVVAVADDMGMHSSQNEQDSRHYAVAAKLPMLEPSDSADCRDFARLAFSLSEEFDTPALLRLSTRVSHSQGLVELCDRQNIAKKAYVKNPQKYVMMPAYARGRHVFVEERMKKLADWAETSDINKVIAGSKKIGVVSAGIAFQYAREAFGENASYLKLGMVNPLPLNKLREFAASVDTLYVIEELDGVIEGFLRANGIDCKGKELFSPIGEYSAELIRSRVLGLEPSARTPMPAPVRPPVLCPGCPHRGVFYVLSKLKLVVSGDIGCYTLGANPPLSAMDSTICMGASVSALHGMVTADPEMAKHSVAVIGDSTFVHSGITGLINIIYNRSNATILILDNSITGMTGHQQNPCTGLTLQNEPTHALDLELLVKAVGVKRVRTADPFELCDMETALREELEADEPSVIIVRRPCALLKSVKRLPALHIDADKCKKCRKCMSIGCPAISFDTQNGASVEPTLCTGCGLCAKLCSFGAFETPEQTSL